MADSVYAPPKAHLGAGHERQAHPFYVVATLKMTVLLVGTLGLYAVYWYYQNWLLYKKEAQRTQAPDANIWPVFRAVLGPIYTRPLLREVDEHGKANARAMRGSVNAIAPAMFFLGAANYYLGFFVPETSPYYDAANIAAVVLFVPLIFIFRKAQNFINDSCGDPTGESNRKFTAANVAWLVVSAALIAYVIYGIFVPAE